MKKLILCFAICFGVLLSQDVVAQNSNLQSTPIEKQVIISGNNGTNAGGNAQISNINQATPQLSKLRKQLIGISNPTNSELSRLPLINANNQKKILTPVQK